jgi:hypothetical protein
MLTSQSARYLHYVAVALPEAATVPADIACIFFAKAFTNQCSTSNMMQNALDREICQALSPFRIDKGTTASVCVHVQLWSSLPFNSRVTNQTRQAPDLLVSRLGPRFITHHLR